MTNREWLSSLSTHELAKVMKFYSCANYCISGTGKCGDCVEGIKEWLNTERIEPMPELQVGDVLTSSTNQTFVVVHKDYAYNVSEERIDSLNWVLEVHTIVGVLRVDINGKCQSIWRDDNE